VGYLLLADSRTFVCRTWDDLAAKLVWAREEGYRVAKLGVRTAMWTGRCCPPSRRSS